jgi:excisionase family DNA binding protein
MTHQKPSDLITAAEARVLLGVSRVKIAQLLKRGDLRCYSNPLDGREKLISRAEVEALKPKRAEAA